MATKIFELPVRIWEENREALLEDYFSGRYHYLPIEKILTDLERRSMPFKETPSGIIIRELKVSYKKEDKLASYILAARRPDLKDAHEFKKLNYFEVVAKGKNEQPLLSNTSLGNSEYPGYARIGLYTLDEELVTEGQLTDDTLTAFKVVILKNLMDLYIERKVNEDQYTFFQLLDEFKR